MKEDKTKKADEELKEAFQEKFSLKIRKQLGDLGTIPEAREIVEFLAELPAGVFYTRNLLSTEIMKRLNDKEIDFIWANFNKAIRQLKASNMISVSNTVKPTEIFLSERGFQTAKAYSYIRDTFIEPAIEEVQNSQKQKYKKYRLKVDQALIEKVISFA